MRYLEQEADLALILGAGMLAQWLAWRTQIPSIIALLLVTGFWALLARLRISGALAAGEANITQTTASSSANIISGGLVAPIPALAMLSGGEARLFEVVNFLVEKESS